MRPVTARVLLLILPCVWPAEGHAAAAIPTPAATGSLRQVSRTPPRNTAPLEVTPCNGSADSLTTMAGFDDDTGKCGHGDPLTCDEISTITDCLAVLGASGDYTVYDGTLFHGSDIAKDLGGLLSKGQIGSAADMPADTHGCTNADEQGGVAADPINVNKALFQPQYVSMLCAVLAHEWVHAQSSLANDACEDAEAYDLENQVYLRTGGSKDSNYGTWAAAQVQNAAACSGAPAPSGAQAGLARLAGNGDKLPFSNAPSGGGTMEFGSFGGLYLVRETTGEAILSSGGVALSTVAPLPLHLFFSGRHVARSDHDVLLVFGSDTTSSSNPVGVLTAFDADATHLFGRQDLAMTGVKHPSGADCDPSTNLWYVLDTHSSGSGITVWHDTNDDGVPDAELPAAFASPGFPGLEGGMSIVVARGGPFGSGLLVTSEDLRSHGWHDYNGTVAFLRDSDGDGTADESASRALADFVEFPPMIEDTPTEGSAQLVVRAMAGHAIEIWRSDATGGSRVELLGSGSGASAGLTSVPLSETLVGGWYVIAVDATLGTRLAAATLVLSPTAIAIALEEATVVNNVVHLAWIVPDARGASCAVLRRTESGEWEVVGSGRPGAGEIVSYDDAAVNPGGRYAYKLLVETAGNRRSSDEIWVSVSPGAAAPATLRLDSVFPNPFAGRAYFSVGVPRAGTARLAIYSVTGRRVATLMDQPVTEGWRAVSWDGRGSDGQSVASGTYFARLESAGQVQVLKFVVAR